MSTDNQALVDELEAVNSIYNAETIVVSEQPSAGFPTATVLSLPDLPFSFLLSFPADYPDAPPTIDGIQSTGPSTKKGDGEAALSILRDVLGQIFVPGQVCLFDLIEETSPLLHSHTRSSDATQEPDDLEDTFEAETASTADQSDITGSTYASTPPSISSRTTATTSLPPTNWTISPPLTVAKSTFVAHALRTASLPHATSSISQLLSTNKKLAAATHNITAWRIKHRPHPNAPEIVIQDCDDDGETAAGGRLLHLMQLMGVWNVVVVVSRWYGGVKLGADRFRCINNVAREVLTLGGFVEGDGNGNGEWKGHGGKGKKK